MQAPLSGHGSGKEQDIQFVVRVHQARMTYEHLLAIWQAADSLGYDGASLYDLLSAPCLECWTALTMLTTATRRLRAIPMVLSQTYRHPVVLAKMAATLDVASGGRLVLGLGAGGSQHDHEAAGIPWLPLQERLLQLEEAIQLLRFLWSGQQGTFRSRRYGTVQGGGYPRPAQLAGPPILVGGHGERYVLRTVARVADLCNIGFDLSPQRWQSYQQRWSAPLSKRDEPWRPSDSPTTRQLSWTPLWMWSARSASAMRERWDCPQRLRNCAWRMRWSGLPSKVWLASASM